MARYYTKKPTYGEIKNALYKYTNRHQDEDPAKWQDNLKYENPFDGMDIEYRVPKTVFWETRLHRRIAPPILLILGAVLFIIDHFQN